MKKKKEKKMKRIRKRKKKNVGKKKEKKDSERSYLDSRVIIKRLHFLLFCIVKNNKHVIIYPIKRLKIWSKTNIADLINLSVL